ncbi:MAG: cyclopropane-fatty-acyl-phospholipid synthase family protein [Pseudomonadota bacterium]
MSNPSVSRIRLPQVGLNWRSENLAKNLFLKVLSRLRTGSLIIRDGQEVITLGSDEPGPEEPRAEIIVNDQRAWSRILLGGTLASGESYIRGEWSSPDLPEVIRLFSANLQTMASMQRKRAWYVTLSMKLMHYANRNTREGSKRNISAHYDLGNDFFKLFLDDTMMYSSALFSGHNWSLEEAAVAKLDEICQQLELKESDHLVEIGTGWGGMAIYAARHYGCRVTTTTISQEQYEYARAKVAELGLTDRITVLCKDYRALEGQFDKLVSIEMIEAVGHEFYSEYFQRCSQLLKPDGKMVIQAITMADQRYEQARDSVDFIKHFIFPGGCLPSLEVIAQNLSRHTDMQMVHLRDITEDYADTLASWRERFFAQLEAVKAQGFDEQFVRMWDFYLSYCEGGFRERIISTVQLSFAKPGYRFTA